MSDIFISYSSEDRDRILPLVNALEKTGWSVFWDRTIPAGKTWWEFIGAEIQSCRSVVVVWTEDSIKSNWVYEEADTGKRKRILIPVLFDKVEPPFGFGGIQAANLAAWDGDNSSPTFSRLIADIAAILGPSPAAVNETEERRRLEAEAQRKAEEERLREQERLRSEEEARRKADEENQKRIEEERNHAEQEAEQRRLEAEAQRKVEQDCIREQERQRSEEEAKRKVEEENRRRIEEERKLSQEAERRRLEVEEQRKAEAERLREQERQRSEEEARRKAEQENQRRIEEAANRARLWQEDTQETRPDRPEPVKRSDRRQLYAGGAVISAILIAVIASLIMKEKKEEPAPPPPPPPPIAYQEQATVSRDASSTSVFRDRLKSGREGPEMVVIPAGSFKMGDVQGGGDKDELPVRTVKFQKPFAIGRYEVTFEEYDQFAKAANRQLPGDGGWGRGRRPVINVSWEDAVAYARWLSEQTGKRYRLPTEAEWEYAARGGKETAYWWDRDIVKGMANCDGCGSQWDNKQTAPVGSFKPNPFGLYDTAGNVLEWVEDCWHDNYNVAPTNGSAWKEAGGGICDGRAIRGGSWDLGPVYLRSSNRDRGSVADTHNDGLGFRLAQDL